MISAFDVYLVMQLEGIKGLLFLVSTLSGLLTTAAGLASFFLAIGEDEVPPLLKRLLRWGVVFLVVSSTLNAFIPTPKTAAAMYLLPTLTSPEVASELKPEAKELYQLAKDALRGLATGEEPKPEKD